MAWQDILGDKTGNRNTLLVAHNAVNQALVATAIGLPPTYFRRLLQNNAATTVLDFQPNGNGPPRVNLDRVDQVKYLAVIDLKFCHHKLAFTSSFLCSEVPLQSECSILSPSVLPLWCPYMKDPPPKQVLLIPEKKSDLCSMQTPGPPFVPDEVGKKAAQEQSRAILFLVFFVMP